MLTHCHQKDIWATDDLSIELRLTDSTAIKNALYFWNNHGVLKNSSDENWRLLEVKDSETDAAAAHGETRLALQVILGGILTEPLFGSRQSSKKKLQLYLRLWKMNRAVQQTLYVCTCVKWERLNS